MSTPGIDAPYIFVGGQILTAAELNWNFSWLQQQITPGGVSSSPVDANAILNSTGGLILLSDGSQLVSSPPADTTADANAILNATGGLILLSDGSQLVHT